MSERLQLIEKVLSYANIIANPPAAPEPLKNIQTALAILRDANAIVRDITETDRQIQSLTLSVTKLQTDVYKLERYIVLAVLFAAASLIATFIHFFK